MKTAMAMRFYLKNWRLALRSLLLRRKLKVSYGAHSYGVPEIRWWGENSGLVVGKYCSIARGVTIFLGGNHRIDWVTTYPFNVFAYWREDTREEGHPWTRGDVVIENDVWLGDGCTILSGVRVCNGAVVAARAVVAKDVPPYAIVAGNPARIIKYRFDADRIALLQQLQWWDWPEQRIRAAMSKLLSPEPLALLEEKFN
jgi:acetyltransferase-like isoleucine patch superfamily enzyme